MTRRLSALLMLAVLTGACHGAWFQAIESSSEVAVADKIDLTVRFMPARTHHVDKVELECVYHQEFPWVNVRGKEYTKIHEPVTFMYRRADVKMVHDLDEYISFRAPFGKKALTKKYGPKVFNKDYPITIRSIKVRGYSGDTQVWAYEVPLNETLDAMAILRQEPAPTAGSAAADE